MRASRVVQFIATISFAAILVFQLASHVVAFSYMPSPLHVLLKKVDLVVLGTVVKVPDADPKLRGKQEKAIAG